jgi:hypothetical protein
MENAKPVSTPFGKLLLFVYLTVPKWYSSGLAGYTWILNLYSLPLAIVRIDCTIVRVIEPQRLLVVLRNGI